MAALFPECVASEPFRFGRSGGAGFADAPPPGEKACGWADPIRSGAPSGFRNRGRTDPDGGSEEKSRISAPCGADPGRENLKTCDGKNGGSDDTLKRTAVQRKSSYAFHP